MKFKSTIIFILFFSNLISAQNQFLTTGVITDIEDNKYPSAV